MARLAARDCSAGEYRWVLSRLAGIYAVVDARLRQADTLAPPTLSAYRGRGGLLAGDVQRIGLCGLPLALSVLAPIASPAAYLGAS